jgi:hypothetical protein
LEWLRRREAARALTRECVICFDDVIISSSKAGTSSRLREGKVLTCGHSYCITCLSQYVLGKLQAPQNCYPVKCPKDGCSTNLTDDEAKSLLPASKIQLWEDKKVESNPKEMVGE